MKKALFLIIGMLLLPLNVYAQSIFGGETVSYTIDRCEQLSVSIIPSEDGEWIIDGCEMANPTLWLCDCSDNFVLNLTSAANAIGTFDIEIEYSYSEPEPVKETMTFTYPQSVGVIYRDITLNVTKTIERTVYINQTEIINQTIEDTTKIQELDETVHKLEEKIEFFERNFFVLPAICMVLIIFLIYIIVKRQKMKTQADLINEKEIKI